MYNVTIENSNVKATIKVETLSETVEVAKAVLGKTLKGLLENLEKVEEQIQEGTGVNVVVDNEATIDISFEEPSCESKGTEEPSCESKGTEEPSCGCNCATKDCKDNKESLETQEVGDFVVLMADGSTYYHSKDIIKETFDIDTRQLSSGIMVAKSTKDASKGALVCSIQFWEEFGKDNKEELLKLINKNNEELKKAAECQMSVDELIGTKQEPIEEIEEKLGVFKILPKHLRLLVEYSNPAFTDEVANILTEVCELNTIK